MWFEKNIHSIILSVTGHCLRNLPPLIHIAHIHLWIFKTLWVIISWVWVIHKRLNVNWKKIHSIILSVTCHSLRNLPPLIHIASYPFVNFWNPMSYISWVWVIHRKLNVIWKNIYSIILSVTCHSLRTIVPLIQTPHIHVWIFKILWVIISWVWVIHKWLNVNWKKIHSIILSVTCHSLRNLPQPIHIAHIHS